MGTKLAPTYANIYMGNFGHNNLSHTSMGPSLYKRYIDDLILHWPHSEKELF